MANYSRARRFCRRGTHAFVGRAAPLRKRRRPTCSRPARSTPDDETQSSQSTAPPHAASHGQRGRRNAELLPVGPVTARLTLWRCVGARVRPSSRSMVMEQLPLAGMLALFRVRRIVEWRNRSGMHRAGRSRAPHGFARSIARMFGEGHRRVQIKSASNCH